MWDDWRWHPIIYSRQMQTVHLACDAKFLNSQRDERWTIHGTDAEASWVLAGAYGVGLGDQQPEEPGKPWHGITIDVSWCIMMYHDVSHFISKWYAYRIIYCRHLSAFSHLVFFSIIYCSVTGSTWSLQRWQRAAYVHWEQRFSVEMKNHPNQIIVSATCIII